MDIKILFNQYLNLSYNDLIKSSKESLEYIIPQLRLILNSEEDVSLVLIYFTSALLSADTTASEKEIMFLSDLLSLSKEEIKAMYKIGLVDEITIVIDHLFDSLNPGLKTHLLNYCLCFMAVDGNIDNKEITFVEKLVSE